MINSYFNLYSHTGTQNLIEDLIVQQIQISGTNIGVIKRELSDNVDIVLREDNSSIFKSSISIEAYIQDVQDVNGIGNQLTFFGLELKDKLTIVVSKRRWKEIIVEDKPMEGDLIYFPLNNTLYEITKVAEDAEFLKHGKNFIWTIYCEVYNPNSGEDISADLNSKNISIDNNYIPNRNNAQITTLKHNKPKVKIQ